MTAHSIDALGKPYLKWLDLWALAGSLCRPGETLVKVAYFSAYDTWLPDRYTRHRVYVTALAATGVECHMARFSERMAKCKSCSATWKTREEKETDVHFALTFLEDAIDNAFDRAIIISADSDYIPAVRKVRKRVLGHSDRELERLHLQAKLIDPITRQFLIEAGIGRDMRVLDIGSGAGDVAILAAKLVGPSGQVVGVDRSPAALARARTRAEEQSLTNVTFRESELSAMAFDEPFDAAIGRYVLCFQPDPATLLRSIAKLVRPGGLIVFHEPDRELMRSVPPAPTYDRACRWVSETYRRSGVDGRMGIKLYYTFLAAGLAGPTMRLHAVIGGANAADEVHLDADQAVILAADIERLGLATASELGADTLVERITREMAANQSVIIGRAEIGAWSRV